MAKNLTKNKMKILPSTGYFSNALSGEKKKSLPPAKEVLFSKHNAGGISIRGGAETFHSSAALQTEEPFGSFEQSRQIEEFQKNLLELEDKVSRLNFMMKEVQEAFAISKAR